MKIYCNNVMRRRFSAPIYQNGMEFPCVILGYDNWDDYSYKTSFYANIYNSDKRLVHSSSVKILQDGELRTSLPEDFDSLSENYCSLWQSINDYEFIKCLPFGEEIFIALNDINFNSHIRKKYEHHSGVTESLRRFSEAERAYQEGPNVLNNIEAMSSFDFSYIEDSPSPTPFGTIQFPFSKNLDGLYRTVALIGRNGVGKTTLLANLASSLSGIEKGYTALLPRRPFSKIIAVSYSTFDDFYRPKGNEKVFSYFYCGIRGTEDHELLSQEEIYNLFRDSFKRIKLEEKLDTWKTCMNILYLNQLDSYFPNLDNAKSSFQKLSAGQKIMTMSFTQIIDNIERNSLLLFDEPETHLHPNGQNTLYKCLDYILNKFDSFAILSTHSTIFIQNIPSVNVIKMFSVKGRRVLQTLDIESFGQHFSTLTEEIFGFSENNLYYVEKLKCLYERKELLGHEYDDVLSLDSIGVKYNLNNMENA